MIRLRKQIDYIASGEANTKKDRAAFLRAKGMLPGLGLGPRTPLKCGGPFLKRREKNKPSTSNSARRAKMTKLLRATAMPALA